MIMLAERRFPSQAPVRQVNWRGRSGRFYALTPERLETFALTTSALYMLARGTVPIWVGSAHDVINDAPSRARFRLALEAADRAFLVATDGDEISRMTTVWDLESAEPVTSLSAA